MSTTIWPTMTDYVAAVQDPDNLVAAELDGIELVTLPPLGLPAVASGRNAVVFQVEQRGDLRALRCFISHAGLERDRYMALDRYLQSRPMSGVTAATWIDDAVSTSGSLRPAVIMPWVDGSTLSEWVANRLGEPESLRALAARWGDLMAELRRNRFAHGDLQHGNVLINPDGELKLVDLDGVWLPTAGLSAPAEFGHPNYQHPDRLDQCLHSEHIDWFAALVVHTSLLALAADRSRWRYNNDDNLIFCADDFRGPTEIWDDLASCDDPSVRHAAALLAEGCARPAATATDLATLLTRGFDASQGATPRHLPPERSQPGRAFDSHDRPASPEAPPGPPPSLESDWFDGDPLGFGQFMTAGPPSGSTAGTPSSGSWAPPDWAPPPPGPQRGSRGALVALEVAAVVCVGVLLAVAIDNPSIPPEGQRLLSGAIAVIVVFSIVALMRQPRTRP